MRNVRNDDGGERVFTLRLTDEQIDEAVKVLGIRNIERFPDRIVLRGVSEDPTQTQPLALPRGVALGGRAAFIEIVA